MVVTWEREVGIGKTKTRVATITQRGKAAGGLTPKEVRKVFEAI